MKQGIHMYTRQRNVHQKAGGGHVKVFVLARHSVDRGLDLEVKEYTTQYPAWHMAAPRRFNVNQG